MIEQEKKLYCVYEIFEKEKNTGKKQTNDEVTRSFERTTNYWALCQSLYMGVLKIVCLLDPHFSQYEKPDDSGMHFLNAQEKPTCDKNVVGQNTNQFIAHA